MENPSNQPTPCLSILAAPQQHAHPFSPQTPELDIEKAMKALPVASHVIPLHLKINRNIKN
jgi:hypothetical protein